MATVNCTLNGQKARGGVSYGSSAVYMGYGNGSTHYEAGFEFTTGSFVGVSKSITFNIKMSNSGLGTDPRTYRWALLTSDNNAKGTSTTTNYYYNTHDDVVDENQIAQGVVEWFELNKDTHKTLTIETNALESKKTYYLMLWPYSTSPLSFLTISALQWHGDVVLNYATTFSVDITHYLMNKNGSFSKLQSSDDIVNAGSTFTPQFVETPPTNQSDGAVMFAYSKSGKVKSGTVEGFSVNDNTSVEIYYPLASGTVIVNIGGTARLCEVNYKS